MSPGSNRSCNDCKLLNKIYLHISRLKCQKVDKKVKNFQSSWEDLEMTSKWASNYFRETNDFLSKKERNEIEAINTRKECSSKHPDLVKRSLEKRFEAFQLSLRKKWRRRHSKTEGRKNGKEFRMFLGKLRWSLVCFSGTCSFSFWNLLHFSNFTTNFNCDSRTIPTPLFGRGGMTQAVAWQPNYWRHAHFLWRHSVTPWHFFEWLNRCEALSNWAAHACTTFSLYTVVR